MTDHLKNATNVLNDGFEWAREDPRYLKAYIDNNPREGWELLRTVAHNRYGGDLQNKQLFRTGAMCALRNHLAQTPEGRFIDWLRDNPQAERNIVISRFREAAVEIRKSMSESEPEKEQAAPSILAAIIKVESPRSTIDGAYAAASEILRRFKVTQR